jgi:hypothetical protein
MVNFGQNPTNNFWWRQRGSAKAGRRFDALGKVDYRRSGNSWMSNANFRDF